ncbi:MAG: serine--tRNA ligase [Sphingobacteriaceae bacterium]|nr:serine--tRNA ligase [Sphingobacteriaceae bacterium]
MLQLAHIRQHTEQVIQKLQHKHLADAASLVHEVLATDDARKAAQVQLDQLLAEQNQLAKEIGGLMKNGQKEAAEALKTKVAVLKEQSKALEDQKAELEKKSLDLLVRLPNLPHHSVPAGKTPDDNEVVYQVAEIPVLPADSKPHWELTSQYDIIDFELGVKVTGAGFPVYKGAGAKLQRALINFFLDQNTAAGYLEVQPPILVNEDSGFGTGQLPDKEGQMYYVGIDNLYLIPTAEVPVTNLYRDVILKESDFPVRNTAYTPCFRREAGSYGKDVRGLNRLHQFDKVEIVELAHPDKSYETLEKMRAHVASLVEALELPYRILRLCGGDMSFASALTYDFEVWSAAQGRWLEVSSVSNFESFQANRLKLRYKAADGKNYLAHTLNGSAMALPRIVAALLENHQTPDGIRIPKALVPYTGFEYIR